MLIATRRRAATAVVALMAAASPATAQIMDAEFDAQWGLAAIGAQHALEKGITGAGVAVGVVDEIFQTTHPEFAGRVHPYAFNPLGQSPGDHGTHVAGIIGAGRNGFGMEGVAPEVLLSSISAFAGSTRQEWYENIAIAYYEARAAGIGIFNNSWGPSNTPITNFTPATAEAFLGTNLVSRCRRRRIRARLRHWQ
jgi:subtilase-type serine protease